MAQPHKLIWICHGTVVPGNPNIKHPYIFNFNCLNFYCPNGTILHSNLENMISVPQVICEDNYDFMLSKYPENHILNLREMFLSATRNDYNNPYFNNVIGIYLCTNTINKLYDIRDIIAASEANGNGIHIQEIFRLSEDFVRQNNLNPANIDLCLFCCRSTIDSTTNFVNRVKRTFESMDIEGGGVNKLLSQNNFLSQVSENNFYKYIGQEKNVKFMSKNDLTTSLQKSARGRKKKRTKRKTHKKK